MTILYEQSGACVRSVEIGDIENVINMLRSEFSPNVSEEAYRRVFQYAWMKDLPDRGLILDVNGKLAGYLGTVYSERSVNGKKRLFCNIFSWYMRPAYRGKGLGLPLLQALIQRKNLIITGFTPNLNSGPIIKKYGFKTLSTGFIVFHPKLAIGRLMKRGAEIITLSQDIYKILDSDLYSIVEHHLKYGCSVMALTNNREVGLIISKRRMSTRVPYVSITEILHVANKKMVLDNLASVYRSMILRDKTTALAVDETIFGAETPIGWRRDRLRYFLGDDIVPDQIDSLYSEIILLD